MSSFANFEFQKGDSSGYYKHIGADVIGYFFSFPLFGFIFGHFGLSISPWSSYNWYLLHCISEAE